MILKKFTLKNFRSFKELAEFELRPINILTGQNNSGKSSLIKALVLLQNAPLSKLDFSKEPNNLGEFKMVLNDDCEEGDSMLFKITLGDMLGFEFYTFQNEKSLECEYIADGEFGLLKSIKIFIDDKLVCSSDINESIFIDLIELTENFKIQLNTKTKYWNIGELQLSLLTELKLLNEEDISNKNIEVESQFEEHKNSLNMMLTHFNIDQINPYQLPYDISEKPSALTWLEVALENINNNISLALDDRLIVDSEEEKGINLGAYYNKGYLEIIQRLILPRIERFLKEVKATYNINYIKIYRTSDQRIYADKDNSAFALVIRKFIGMKANQGYRNALKFINNWLEEFELGSEISYERIHGVASTFYVNSKGKRKSIVDVGSGVGQIIPLIIELAYLISDIAENPGNRTHSLTSTLLIIEEPESNLHPKLQSKIADMIIDANKICNNLGGSNYKFIIETHSEYLIRKFQYLTAKKEIKPEDTVIYYVNSPKVVKETGAEQVVKIEIKIDGSLTNDFGHGFFDEAAQLVTNMIEARKNSLN